MRSDNVFKISFIILLLLTSVDAKCISFGLIPYGNVVDINKEYQKLNSWMEENTQVCIDITISKNYEDTIKALAQKQIDCARVGPFSYVLANKEVKLEPLVVGAKKDGSSTYKSHLITNSELANKLDLDGHFKGLEGIKELGEIIKQTDSKYSIGFTDTSSTSGYLIPLYYLHRADVEVDRDFHTTLFSRTHEASVLSVKSSVSDFSFSNDKAIAKLKKSGSIDDNQIFIAWTSDPIPDSPIVCRKDLDSELKKRFKTTLLKVPYSYIPKYGKVAFYKEVTHKNYEIIEAIQEFVDTSR